MPATLLTPSHLAIILIVLLLIFGPKRLPQVGRAVGHGMREFKDAITGAPAGSPDGELESHPRLEPTPSGEVTSSGEVRDGG